MPSFNSKLAFSPLILGKMNPLCMATGSKRPQDTGLGIYRLSVAFFSALWLQLELQRRVQ